MVAINSYDEYGIPAPGNIGRFLQSDPIGYDDGMNWYDYVGSDPVNGSDPTGMRERQLEGGGPKPSDPHYFEGAGGGSYGLSSIDVIGTRIDYTICPSCDSDLPFDDRMNLRDLMSSMNYNWFIRNNGDMADPAAEREQPKCAKGETFVGTDSNGHPICLSNKNEKKESTDKRTDLACGILPGGSVGCKQMSYSALCKGATDRLNYLGAGYLAKDLLKGSLSFGSTLKGAFGRSNPMVGAEVITNILDIGMYCK